MVRLQPSSAIFSSTSSTEESGGRSRVRIVLFRGVDMLGVVAVMQEVYISLVVGFLSIVSPDRAKMHSVGEFSSPKQGTFYHYNDFWRLEPSTREWTRLEHKGKGPPARSGHRMTYFKVRFSLPLACVGKALLRGPLELHPFIWRVSGYLTTNKISPRPLDI